MIENIMERAIIEDVCSRHGLTSNYINSLTELEKRLNSAESKGTLIVCDLAKLESD